MTSIGIIGSEGRMGVALAAAISEAGQRHCGVDRGGNVVKLASESDVLVDFSSPAALEATLDACVAARKPIVIGTTGLEERHHYLIDDAALGVTLLAHLVREAAARLDPEYDIEVLEMHHRMKVDAPSGTALLLGQAAAEGRGINLDTCSERGRDGLTGARGHGKIGFASLRGGTVAGDHDVIFAGPEEMITLSHRAENRMIFARGAVRAALWLLNQKPERYTMPQVLGLS